ncbi:hypothetical protein EG68_05038 [Paragonimus skrjabini miyazakii]|uniref:Phospholipid-transporting ATPase n=1 Tax=Paragonimus skrjabini miyazakii TaxID=59628 RepID=A0A8S9YB11_9TREM|nr:hypothetical protein EG68_05038 [Paragonimus skrjabini miyazakii]
MRRLWQKILIKLRIRRPPFPPERHIPLGPVSKTSFVSGEYPLTKLYGDNEITTSRYTWYGFIFQNLSEQAQRIANFYFICVAVVQLFTDSPVTPAISIIPLVFVFAVTLIKQGYEDWLRHKADRCVNHIRVEIVTEDGRLNTIKAMEITVGDIVLCRANDTFPCDLLLLSSSEQNGECFITTASLDGETNLKRFVAPELTKIYDSPDLLAKELRGSIICQQPVDDLYTFNGRINLELSDGQKEVCPIGPGNLLLRGACLRNTDFVYACAVYTGQDTKMMLNSKGKRTKFSQVERKLNLYLALILCFLVICSVLSTILSFTKAQDGSWYTPPQRTSAWIVVQTFLGFIVLYNYIIPISLYVTIEVQKFVGSLFFEWDLNMYCQKINERAKVNTSDLIEEMGQVEYLFTDKTGTLTENCMEFRRFATATGEYSLKGRKLFTVLEASTSRRASSPGDMEPELGKEIELSASDSATSDSVDASEQEAVKSIHTLLIILALCHTVRVERALPGEAKKLGKKKRKLKDVAAPSKMIDGLSRIREPPKRGSSALRRASAAQAASQAFRESRRGRKFDVDDYIYQASSPDEKAFVEASRDLGVVYHGLDEAGMHVVTVHGCAVRYRQLDVLEFDATRKCMSVVLQPASSKSREADEQPPVIILCKGAETSMLKRTTPDPQEYRELASYNDALCEGLFNRTGECAGMNSEKAMQKVTDFASCGLRTLVMGARILSANQWREYKSELDSARGQLDNREQALNRIYSKIESRFMLTGCTGIEDMLQDGVPETITALREAGIQVWVLTGDKEETAVNISYSAGHFFQGMNEARITKQEDLLSCNQELDKQVERIGEAKRLNQDEKFGIVIDGQSLNFALEAPLRPKFIQCCMEASTVLCCRLTPLQKAEVVRLIKESRKPPPVTAAIGDGANDVSMILEAHVSFGLFGKEGRQAARAADYAFGRFRFLKSAILYHGHTYYIRVAFLVLYFFYKNLLFTLPQMLFGFFCSYSAQTVYPELYLVFFNITMTSLPIFLFGIFEKPIPENILLNYPSLYRTIVRNRCLSRINLLLWLALATWHAFVIFFGLYFFAFRGQAGGGSSPSIGGGGSAVGDMICFGNLLMITIFITVNLKIYLFSYNLTWIILLGNVLAFLFNLIMFVFLNFFLFPLETGAQLFGTWSVLWGGAGLGTSWIGMIVLVLLALLPDLILRALTDQGWQWRLAELERERLEQDAGQDGAVVNMRMPSPVEVRDAFENSHTQEPFNYVNPSFEWNNHGERIIPRNHRLPVQELFEQGPIDIYAPEAPTTKSRDILTSFSQIHTRPEQIASRQ